MGDMLSGEVAKLRVRRFGTDPGELYDFVPRVSPNLAPPRHMKPIVDLLQEAADSPPVFACTSFPPQTGKTETWLHGFAWLLAKRPSLRVGYITYSQDLADEKSSKARAYALLAGAQIREDTRSKKNWQTYAGGGLRARGYSAPITGLDGLDVIVIDDPFKNQQEAFSKAVRNKVEAEFWSTIWSRRHTRTSILVNHTRWHVDDLIGRIKKRHEKGEVDEPWRFVNVPAVDHEGHSFCPEIRSDEFFAAARRASKEMFWWPLFMGQPRPIEGRLFDGVSLYTELPSSYRVSIGVDLAYTESQGADHSCAVVLASDGTRCYVLDVLRKQVEAPAFADALKALSERYQGAPMLIYSGGGGEKGAAQFMRRAGVPLQDRPAVRDKKIRALPAAAAWNDGHILVPVAGRWVSDFTAEVLDFSGEGDEEDDQIDALAAAYDALAGAELFVDRPTAGRRETPYRARAGGSPYGRRASPYG